MTDKQEWRRRFKAWRAAQSPETHAAISAAICRRIEQLAAYRQAEWVLGYAPMAGEVDVRPLLERALAEGKRVALPRCTPSTHTMTFGEIFAWDELSVGAHRIAEPPATAPTWNGAANTLCLVPALALDKSGHRLGYGGEYYDRFLPTFAGVSVGICPQECLVEALPHEPTDQPVLTIVTEEQ